MAGAATPSASSILAPQLQSSRVGLMLPTFVFVVLRFLLLGTGNMPFHLCGSVLGSHQPCRRLLQVVIPDSWASCPASWRSGGCWPSYRRRRHTRWPYDGGHSLHGSHRYRCLWATPCLRPLRIGTAWLLERSVIDFPCDNSVDSSLGEARS